MEPERRAHERLPYRTTVTIEHTDRTWSGFVLDCSEGGLFAVSYVPALAGERVRLWFQRPADSMMVEVMGKVSRRASRGPENGDPAGVGIQFARRLSMAMPCG